ncbi:MAG: hypothetical protein PHH55_04960, partial [Candidatus Delongbacteria bacterium]|nr:hypothetical protein [Candidatus Delongbacteria bacterium]
MIITDIIIILLLFISGYLSVTFLKPGKEDNFINILTALPFGAGSWSLIWIFISFGLDALSISDNRLTTIVSITAYSLISLYSAVKNFQAVWQKRYFMIFSVVLTAALVFVINLFDSSIIFGDSYSFITWTHRVKDLAGKGFPLFGLSMSNLSALIRPDYHVFAFYPLININLVMLIMFMTVKENGENKYLRIAFPALLILLFSTNFSFVMHTFYVNHHALTAVYLLVFSEYIMNSKTVSGYRESIFVLLTASFLTFIRMEGMIISISVLFFIFYRSGIKNSIRKTAMGIYALFSLVFTGMLMSSLWHNARFSSARYIFAWITFAMFFFITEIMIRKRAGLIKFVRPLFYTGVILVFLILFITNYGHMSQSSSNYLSNVMNTEYWGISNIVLLLISS